MKQYKNYLIPAGVCLILAAVLKFALVGYSFLALCFAALAGVFLAYMALKILAPKHEKPVRVLNKILTYAIILFALALAVTEAVIVSEAKRAGESDPQVEYVIVLGAGVNGTQPSLSLRVRLDAALEYAEAHPEAMLIVSGGKGPGEDISEAQCMADWFIRRGVVEDRIILEDQAESTVENLRFSRAILEELDPDFGGVCLITAGYHIMRAKLMALDNGFTTVWARPASTGYPILELNYYLREAVAVWVYMLTR